MLQDGSFQIMNIVMSLIKDLSTVWQYIFYCIIIITGQLRRGHDGGQEGSEGVMPGSAASL